MKAKTKDYNKAHTILIVEDSPTQAMQVKRILEEEGFTTDVCRNGKDALWYLKEHKPTIIISDIVMPEMDGYQLCSVIKKDETLKDIPVILLTGLTSPEDVIRGLQSGADNFITKPYDKKFLLSRIQYILVNQEVRKRGTTEVGLNIYFMGQTHSITSNRMQIVDLLLSTYEHAVLQNQELKKTQAELETLNKQLEEKVKQRTQRIETLNSVLRAIRGVNQLIVREKDRDRLITEACRILTTVHEYHNAWIALIDDSGELVATAESGLGKEFLPLERLLKEGNVVHCARRALKKSGVIIIEDPSTGCADCPLSKKSHARGAMTVRLEHSGKTYGLLSISIPKDLVRDKEELSLFEEVVGDIAFALYSIEVEQKREHAEERLAESEKFLNYVIEQSPTSIWIADGKGTLARMNQACRELFGVTEAEVVGKYNIFEDNLIEAQGHMPLVRAVFQKGKIARFTIDYDVGEVEHIDVKGGTHRILDVVVSPIRDAQGNVTNAIVQHKDITELRQAEEERDAAFQQLRASNQQLRATEQQLRASNQQLAASERELRDSQERLRLALDASDMGTWRWLPSTNQDTRDAGFNRILGLNSEESTQPVEDFVGRVHPSDRPSVEKAIESAAREKKAYKAEFRIVRPGGEIRWLRDRGVGTYDDRGEMTYMTGAVVDITELRQAEEALRVIAERLELALNASNSGVWDFNPRTFTDTHLSDRWFSMLGYEPGELPQSAETWTSLMHPEDLDRVQRELQGHIEGRSDYSTEFRMQTKDGSYRWIHAMGKVVSRDEDGNPNRMAGIHLDITTRKRAEEERDAAFQQLQASNQQLRASNQQLAASETALRNSEQTARALMDATTDAAFLIDVEGATLAVNEPLARRLGRSREDLIELNIFDLLPPDIAERRRSWVQEVMRTGKHLEEEDEREGIILHNVMHPLFDPNGRVTRVAVFSRDITERKRAEEELRKHRDHLEELVEERTAELRDLNLFNSSILDSSPVGILSYRADGQCVSANESTGPLIGAAREQVLAQNFRTIASWRESGLLAAADRCLETGEPQHALVSIRTTFGKDVVLDTRFARFLLHGEPHLLLTFSDITDRVRAEKELKRYSAQLEAANKELEAFAYSVSHDLRAPLRSINGFSEALLEDYADKVDEQGKDHLRRVREGAQRMAVLIEDLLKLSRITRWEMEHAKVDISALARQTVASLRQSQPERDVEVVIEDGLAPDGDIRLLRVVMENLLDNAWKFTGKTANARIEIGRLPIADCRLPIGEGEAGDARGGAGQSKIQNLKSEIVFFVRDNGVGFDMAYVDKLFGAFQRLHSAAEFAGTGIGLATVQRAVLRHGGRVWAEGEVGKGATFYFTL